MNIDKSNGFSDVIQVGNVLTVTPEPSSSVLVSVEYADGSKVKTSVSSATTFGPYLVDMRVSAILVSGSGASVVESVSQRSDLTNMVTTTTNLTGGIEKIGGIRDAIADLGMVSRRRSPGSVVVDWSQCTISGVTSGWTVVVDPTVTYCGYPSLKITGTNTTTLNATITFPDTVYLGGAKRQHFAVKVGDRAMAGDVNYPVQLRFDYSAGTRHMICAFAGASTRDGSDWCGGTAYDGELAGSGHIPSGAPDAWAKVNSEVSASMLLLMAAAANVTEPIYISPFFTDQQTVPTLTIFADGQYAGQWKYLRHALQRANVRASFAIDVPRVAYDATRMTLAQLQKLYAMGHEMIRHCGGGAAAGWDDTSKYPDGNERALVAADCTAFQTWATTNAMPRGVGYGVVAFTNGMVKTQSLARRKNIANGVLDAGEKKVRVLTTAVSAFDSHFEHFGSDALFLTPSYQLTSSSTTGNIDTLFSKLKERGGWSGITFHDIVLSGATGNNVNVATMDYIMDKIAADVLAGELLVLPMSEAMQTLPLPPLAPI